MVGVAVKVSADAAPQKLMRVAEIDTVGGAGDVLIDRCILLLRTESGVAQTALPVITTHTLSLLLIADGV